MRLFVLGTVEDHAAGMICGVYSSLEKAITAAKSSYPDVKDSDWQFTPDHDGYGACLSFGDTFSGPCYEIVEKELDA